MRVCLVGKASHEVRSELKVLLKKMQGLTHSAKYRRFSYAETGELLSLFVPTKNF